jgi:hypothetical protein
MTSNTLAAGIAAALFTLFAGSIAFGAAPSGDGYECLLSRAPSNTHRIVTVCNAHTPEALARLRAAKCDPAVMGDAGLRDQCAAMTPHHQGDASTPSAAG